MIAGIKCLNIIHRQRKQLPEVFIPTGAEIEQAHGTRITLEGTYVQKVVTLVDAPASWYTPARFQLLVRVYEATCNCPYLVQALSGPKLSRGKYSVRLTPIGSALSSSTAPCDAGQLKDACRCILKALAHLHAAGFGHGDVRWANIVRDYNSFVVIDLEGAVELDTTPSNQPWPDVWGINGDAVLQSGKFTAASDICMVGQMLQYCSATLDSVGSDFANMLRRKQVQSATDALQHKWLSQ